MKNRFVESFAVKVLTLNNSANQEEEKYD